MSEEYKKIQEFFNLNPEEKQEHLRDILEDSVHFFEKFKKVLAEGTAEEKQEIMQELAAFRERVLEETEKIMRKTKLSPEEIDKIAHDPSNFSPEQWEALQEARGKIQEQFSEISSFMEQEEGREKPKKPKKRKKPKKKISG